MDNPDPRTLPSVEQILTKHVFLPDVPDLDGLKHALEQHGKVHLEWHPHEIQFGPLRVGHPWPSKEVVKAVSRSRKFAMTETCVHNVRCAFRPTEIAATDDGDPVGQQTSVCGVFFGALNQLDRPPSSDDGILSANLSLRTLRPSEVAAGKTPRFELGEDYVPASWSSTPPPRVYQPARQVPVEYIAAGITITINVLFFADVEWRGTLRGEELRHKDDTEATMRARFLAAYVLQQSDSQKWDRSTWRRLRDHVATTR